MLQDKLTQNVVVRKTCLLAAQNASLIQVKRQHEK